MSAIGAGNRLRRGGEATVQEIRDSSQQYDNHYVDSPVWREEIARA
ncbi:hypothetical protein [Nocardia flavorosea]|nr:hypothetical protein [Nocardia flavorosea]